MARPTVCCALVMLWGPGHMGLSRQQQLFWPAQAAASTSMQCRKCVGGVFHSVLVMLGPVYLMPWQAGVRLMHAAAITHIQ